MKFTRTLFLAGAAMSFLPGTAFAHPGHELTGLSAGLAHPFLGTDHLLAMLAVGVWAALQPANRAWYGPALFIVMLAGGAALGLAGIGLPFVEPGILASVMLLGFLVAGANLVPAPVSLAAIAAFAVLHGHAHGAEAVEPLAGYATGFIGASAILHLLGYAGGRQLAATRYGIAAAGLSIAAAGAVLAFG